LHPLLLAGFAGALRKPSQQRTHALQQIACRARSREDPKRFPQDQSRAHDQTTACNGNDSASGRLQ
jgi:hypothetical protein